MARPLAFLAEHGDEAAQLHRVRAQLVALSGERDAAGLASPAQRHDEAAAGRELGPDGGGDVPRPDGEDDAVVGCVLLCAQRPVPCEDLDVAVTGGVQRPACLCGDVGVDVDGGDLAGRACEVGEECGVVAGPGADLQDALSGADIKLVQHHRDHAGD